MSEEYAELSHPDRLNPERVEPLVYGGIRYEGEATRELDGKIINSGTEHVRAYDEKTGGLLWDQRIYQIAMNPDLEEDVQWAFITRLALQDDTLMVTNEKNETYQVNLRDGTILRKVE